MPLKAHPGLVRGAEDFHPRVKSKSGAVAQLKKAEAAFETVVEEHLLLMANTAITLFEQSGLGFDEAQDRQITTFELGLDEAYAKLAEPLAKELQGVYQPPVILGAKFALQDLPEGLDPVWTIYNPRMVDWVTQHSMQLATALSQTTKDRMTAQIKAGVLAGESRNEIAARLRTVANDIPQWRSKLIAQTEVTRGYNQGTLDLYRESEIIRGKKWLDGQPGACEFCKSLNGEIVELEGEWETRYGSHPTPPAHPGCRCTLTGVLVEP